MWIVGRGRECARLRLGLCGEWELWEMKRHGGIEGLKDALVFAADDAHVVVSPTYVDLINNNDSIISKHDETKLNDGLTWITYAWC